MIFFLAVAESEQPFVLAYFFQFFLKVFRIIWEFGEKNYFTDHQTASTIQLVVALKSQRKGVPQKQVDRCSRQFSYIIKIEIK